MTVRITDRSYFFSPQFPHDSQSCPLRVASFGHSGEEMVYRWRDPVYCLEIPSVSLYRWTETPATLGDIELSQYHLISLDSGSLNTSVRDSTRCQLSRHGQHDLVTLPSGRSSSSHSASRGPSASTSSRCVDRL